MKRRANLQIESEHKERKGNFGERIFRERKRDILTNFQGAYRNVEHTHTQIHLNIHKYIHTYTYINTQIHGR